VWKVSNTRALAGSKDIWRMSLLSSRNAGSRRQALTWRLADRYEYSMGGRGNQVVPTIYSRQTQAFTLSSGLNSALLFNACIESFKDFHLSFLPHAAGRGQGTPRKSMRLPHGPAVFFLPRLCCVWWSFHQ